MKKVDIKKYFWEYNAQALKEVEKILKDPLHPQFVIKAYTFLSRCDKPKEVFEIIDKEKFIENWPKIRRYWLKKRQSEDFLYWWDSIYEVILKKKRIKRVQKSYINKDLKRIGEFLKEKRLEKGYNQKDLALKTGLRQPDISKIEKGKINITLETLLRICKVLDIKEIPLF